MEVAPEIPEGKGPEWICPGCGNSNYASREVCNTRICRMPRPDLAEKMQGDYGPMRGMPSMGSMARVNPYPLAMPMGMPNMNGFDKAEENWKCPGCGNENFPTRMFCNTRKCRMPKPEGNWTCPFCGNENFPTRMVCNTRRCQAPKPSNGSGMMGAGMIGGKGGSIMDKGMMGSGMLGGDMIGGGMMGAAAALSALTGGSPMGAAVTKQQWDHWVCLGCGNMNYGFRTKCNTRSCQQVRTGFNDGDWICKGCGNHNFAQRDVCNTKKCQMPKPTTAKIGGPKKKKGKKKGNQ